MSYKIVFLDIDGTLLQPDHTICQTTRRAINQLHNQNILVFLATGRPVHAIKDLASELNINSFIGYNGAFALHENEEIVDEPMDRDVISQFVNLADKSGHEMVLYTNGNNFFTSPHAHTTMEFKKLFELDNNDLFTASMAGNVLGTTIMNLSQGEQEKYEFESNIHLAQLNIDGFEHSYDVIRKNVNKGSAIQAVLNRLRIPAEKAVAFGDGLNDKEMFQTVGTSFAMGNGHKDVFQYARYKTTSSTEAGIYNGLRKIGLVN